jgi:hypothetical protein
MGDVHGDVAAQSVDQSPAMRNEQQLRVLADEDGRAAFGETAPEHVIGRSWSPGMNSTSSG